SYHHRIETRTRDGTKSISCRSPHVEELAQIQQYVSQISEGVRSHQVRSNCQLRVVGRSRQCDPVRQLDLLDRIIAGLFLHAIRKHLCLLQHELIVDEG